MMCIIIVVAFILFVVGIGALSEYISKKREENYKKWQELERQKYEEEMNRKREEQKRKWEEEGRRAAEEYKRKQQKEEYLRAKQSLDNSDSYINVCLNYVREFIIDKNNSTTNGYNYLFSKIDSSIEYIKEQNDIIKKYAPSESKDDLASDLISYLNKMKYQISQLEKKVDIASKKTMIDPEQYGKKNQLYWDEVISLDREYVGQTINSYCSLLENGEVMKFEDIDPSLILKCAWFYATETPYSAEEFKKACKCFRYVYKRPHRIFPDLEVAEYYAVKHMGGDEILYKQIAYNTKGKYGRYLGAGYDSKDLAIIASGLMWMGAYQEENIILQHMLSRRMQMEKPLQDRLRLLSSGISKAPVSLQVKSDRNGLYFDVSSLTWRSEDYAGFFDSLAVQDRSFTYSLVVREEDKELFLSQKIAVPQLNQFVKKISDSFNVEYGEDASVSLSHCIAVSENSEEKIDAIVAETKECTYMKLFVNIVYIGRKLGIKFYTLYNPNSTDIAEQKQHALSLLNKLSPSVSMWESSMKDTILMAIQQLINSYPQSGAMEKKEETSDDELAF